MKYMLLVRSCFAQKNAPAKTGMVTFTTRMELLLYWSALVPGRFTLQILRRNMASGLPSWKPSLAAQAFAPKSISFYLQAPRLALQL